LSLFLIVAVFRLMTDFLILLRLTSHADHFAVRGRAVEPAGGRDETIEDWW